MNLLHDIVNYPPVFGVLMLLGSGIVYVLLGCFGNNKGDLE